MRVEIDGCFWCSAQFKESSPATRDHLVPVVMKNHWRFNAKLRYLSDHGNVVFACGTCNKERGILQGLGSLGPRLLLVPGVDPALIEERKARYAPKGETTKKLLKKWIALERKKLGWSPMMMFEWTPAAHLAGVSLVSSSTRTELEKAKSRQHLAKIVAKLQSTKV